VRLGHDSEDIALLHHEIVHAVDGELHRDLRRLIDRCAPSQPVSVFHLHGTADTNHPIGGGKGDGVAGVDFRSALSAVQALATADGCPSTPSPAIAASNRDLTISTWSPCKGGTAVRYVVVAGATHAWMGRAAASGAAASYVGVPYPDLDASRAIWSFLSAHPRA
jgi:polyhydroxybutyrate depolymerase